MAVHSNTIYTIGHSTYAIDRFIGLLNLYNITVLADVRRFPGSRKFPWFNKEELKAELEKNGIQYIHIEQLGGRRKVLENSKNTRWMNASFRGYADYMETEDFKTAIHELEIIAYKNTTAYMCSEAVWWRCHRSMISDYLKVKGWNVLHILSSGKVEAHPYTKPARVFAGHLSYSNENLFQN